MIAASLPLPGYQFDRSHIADIMAGTAPLIIDAVTKHTATVIVAHGLGDSGVGWIWLAENWRRRNKFPEVKFIFPNAPVIPITLVRSIRCRQRK